MKCSCIIKNTIFIIAIFTFAITSAYAQGPVVDDELMKKGIYLYRQENYDEALEIFQDMTEKSGGSSLAEYYLGLTYKRLENYVEAKKHLEKSLNLRPKIKGALIELIDLLYRLGDHEQATKWITVAEEEGIRPAQAKFLKGLTLQKAGDYEGSIKAFEESIDLDDRLTQSANYQIGVNYIKMKRFQDARYIFKETFAVDPYSDIADYADKYINALDRKIERQRPFHFSAKFAYEYDSNVLLQPADSPFITEVSDQDDTRQVFDVKGDYTFRTEDNFLSLKTGYGLHVAKQNNFGKYNIIGNNISAQGNLSFNKVLVTFPVNYSHTNTGNDMKNYLSSFTVGNINNVLTAKSQMAQLGILYKNDYYMRPTTLNDESRTGNEIIATAGYFWFFAENKGFVNIRYSFDKDWAKGANWRFIGNRVGVSLLYPFWEKFKLTASGEMFFQNFDEKNSIFDKKRNDQVYSGATGLSYELMKGFELQVKYTYVNDRSTLSVYEYDRNIVSAGCEYRF